MKVYLIGKTDVMRKASQLLHHEPRRINRVIILGGGVIGYSLAFILESDKQNSFLVKIIEKDAERVQELNRKLSRTTVLQGDGTEVSYFNEEKIADADILVAATEDDRTNIVASIMGQKLGVHKIVSELTRIGYASQTDQQRPRALHRRFIYSWRGSFPASVWLFPGPRGRIPS